jgi:hypothetical protein
MAGSLVAAVFRARQESSAIRLTSGEESSSDGSLDIKDRQPGEASDNPLSGIDVPPKTLAFMFAGTIAGSIASAFVFVVSFSAHSQLLPR